MRLKKIKRQLAKYGKADFDMDHYLVKNYIVDDRAIIPITLQSKEELFVDYDTKKLVINPDIIHYIESIVYYIPYEYSIVLSILGVTFTDDEKEQVVEALDSQFGLVAHDKKVDLHYNDRKALILFVLGFLILSISYFLQQHSNLKFIFEIVSIAGTFSIWEFVDTLWFDRTSLRFASLNAGQLACAKITFEESEESV